MPYKKRTRNLYDPNSKELFAVSRSRIDRFLECPRCFYLDRRLGLDRPRMPGFSLNNAVDALLKKEFDILREKGHVHDLMKEYRIDLIPLQHKDLPIWRDDIYKYVGATVLHKPTNLKIQGIVDDIWVDKSEVLYIVDYKATSTRQEISLEDHDPSQVPQGTARRGRRRCGRQSVPMRIVAGVQLSRRRCRLPASVSPSRSTGLGRGNRSRSSSTLTITLA